MTVKAFSKQRVASFRPPAPLPEFEQRQPPSSALINVILQYADVQQPLGGSRYNLRLSAARMKDPVIKTLLGREAKRLADVSVFWDEQEGEIIQVLDAAAAPEPTSPFDEFVSEFDTFELTELALDYVARHRKRK